jgi:hyperosmotically inducible protein
MRTTSIRFLLATALATSTLACGGPDPEAELVEASQAVEAAKSEVETARATVEKREAEVQEAQQRLSEARAALQKAQQDVAARKATVDASATDAVLFRTVQKQLLHDEKLQEVAISASVVNGVVTLTGDVANAAQRDRAVELARTTPGVANVESRITVPVAAPKKKQQSK